MVGLAGAERPVLRAYSIASANHEEHLEFLSIKVPGGPLTSRLQHIRSGDEVLISRKPTGTLLLSDLNPGRRLFLLEHRDRRRALHGPHQGPGSLRSASRRWCWCTGYAGRARAR